MDLIIGFFLFLAGMAISIIRGTSLIYPMIAALIIFFLIAFRRGFKTEDLIKMAISGARRSLVVVLTMLLIGALTSLWRQCGTIACFTYYGVHMIPSRVFILAAFLLSAAMSYALGTSFGTCSAVGIILITIARANGISPVITGGAIMSGIYTGDRGSPASSAASLVAGETGTDVTVNIRIMLRESILPLAVCTVLYALLSFIYPVSEADRSVLTVFPNEFNMSLLCLLPTVLLLILAFAGMNIRRAMLIDIVFSFILTIILQKTPVLLILKQTFIGYTPNIKELEPVLSGGGICSMLQIVSLLVISNGCAGVFRGTGMLHSVEHMFTRIALKAGRFPSMVCASVLTCMIFCNQTIGVVMTRQCMENNYKSDASDRRSMMLDLEDSVILLAGLVPWCIASSVPLGMLGCGISALPFAFYLYLLPIWHFIRTKTVKNVN